MRRLRSSTPRAALVVAGVCLLAAAPNQAQAVPDGSSSPMRASPTAPGRLPGPALTNAPSAPETAPRITLAANAEPSIIAGNPVTAPLKWAGKYYTQDGAGKAWSCTAQFITNRVILLAAHCVKDEVSGVYYPIDNAAFLLQYQNGGFSKEYHVVCRATWNGWPAVLRPGEDLNKESTMTAERRKEYLTQFEQSWQWDYALVLLDADSITGHYNYSINAQWDGAVATGYPHDLMGGKVIQAVRGDVFSVKDMASRGDEPNEQVMWQGNPDLTQGVSGGAWVSNFSPDVSPNTNIVVGLNSYGVDSRPGGNFGPLFTDKFVTLLNYVQAGCR